MFADPVVIRRNRAGTDVDLVPQFRISDVTEVVHLAAISKTALLHFHEIADSASPADLGGRSEVGERANAYGIADDRTTDHRMHNLHRGAKGCIFNQAAWSEPTVVSDLAVSADVGLRFDQHITAKAAVFAQGAAGGINKGDPLVHPVVPKPLLKHGFALSKLFAVVDAVHFIGIGNFKVHGVGQHLNRVGEVELALIVIGAQLG